MMDKLESARKANQDKVDADSNQPSSSSTPKPANSEVAARPTITVKPAESIHNPFTQLGVQNTKVAGDQSASTGSSRPSRKRSAPDVDDADSASTPRKTTPSQPAAQPAPPQPRKPQPETDEDYAHRVLSQVFRVSVDPHHMTIAQNQRLVFLPKLNQELNDLGDPLKLSIGTLDQAIIEACTSWSQSKPLLEYLLPCWKRAVKAANTAKNISAPRQEILEEAKRLCMSNCLFSLTMPALYWFVYITTHGKYAFKILL